MGESVSRGQGDCASGGHSYQPGRPIGEPEGEGGITVLVVDDDPVLRAKLTALLTGVGYSVISASNGSEARDQILVGAASVVVSDWYMPLMDGVDLCRWIRGRRDAAYVYFILVTSHGGKQQYLSGMEAGADDFITKPVDPDELRARLKVAVRILGLRQKLWQLEGLLPICSYCKNIRDGEGKWRSLESYVQNRSQTQFSHGVCAECYSRYLEPQLDALTRDG
jgi:phosphoserine phosphatase RsbU/P